MNKQEVRESLSRREVHLREIFIWSLELLRERLGQYILLTIIIFLPTNLLLSFLLEQLPETVDTTQYLRVSGMQLLTNLFSMIACSVCVIMVGDQLKEESGEKKSFGVIFYEGIRTWPLFFLTTVMLMAALVGVLLVLTILSSFIPVLLVPAMAAIIILAFLLVVFMYGSNVIAARHRVMLRRNLEMLLEALKNHMGRTIGLILLVSLIGLGLSMPLLNLFEVAVGNRLSGIGLVIAETLIQTVLSIVNIYADIAVCLRFVNLEQIRNLPVQNTIM